ncbi:fungal transcription factor regulatory middle homology region [Aspergillus parasiticus SU-1]|uniref:Fungal transcription factor regulatory middle homology region n=1 Tax=Aspergillus parasiticus (strain ATCC 56775 / NRRL 5862 / SRRC 143 / SU-1) TaxID=1403190 RepID=A0A0F0ID08_ASPPU|nr:fungal transcription factor regulatory middle homology region [Aspergillus parasiticus SU-1]
MLFHNIAASDATNITPVELNIRRNTHMLRFLTSTSRCSTVVVDQRRVNGSTSVDGYASHHLPQDQVVESHELSNYDGGLDAQDNNSAFFRYYGIPVFSPMGQKWIQSHRGTSDILKTLLSFGLPWASYPSHSTSEQEAGGKSGGTPVELPDRFVTEACIAFYKCGKVGLIYPIADMSLLEESVKTAYSPSSDESPQALSIAKAFVLSFVTFCSAADRREHMSYPVDGERCAFEAESMLSTVYDPAHGLGKLQVLLLLLLFHFSQGRLELARELMISIARSANDLSPAMRLSEPPSTPEGTVTPCCTSYKESTFRTLYWHSFMLDKELAFRTGTPVLMLAESLIPASLNATESPNKYLSKLLPTHDPQNHRSETSISHLKLSLIMSRVYSELYEPQSLKKPDTETLRTIRALDDELEEWRLSIPRACRPTLHISDLPTQSTTDVELLLINLRYHHSLGCIHQAVSRCQPCGPMTEALRSSLNLSVRASVSSLEILRATRFTLSRELFWYVTLNP